MRKSMITGVILLAIIMISVASLLYGAVHLSGHQVWQGLFSGSEHYFTIHEYRLPRLFLAVIVGALLAGAGTLVQGVIRNPLASPDILGISHGAGLAAVLWMIVRPGTSVYWLPFVALAGGLSAAMILLLLCRHFIQPVRLALTGVALSALLGCAIDFLLLTQPMEINNALLWLTGSLWGRSWNHILMLAPWLATIPFALWRCHSLNLLTLGDDKANTLGVSITKTRLWFLGIAIIWTSASVAVVGPLSFLGLVSPHLARQMVGGRHQILLPVSMLIGALLLLSADFLSRVAHPPLELPAGILTAVIGAPYFLYLLTRLK
ncbi:Fe(3+) dicitrate ABC transporter permease subunit FecD [Vibrio salinus]|uniref:Fe(3+) dicitrate ABC transporter permease subunit FecD n=1 Tax=Vibrio salinus TaxID=2899784 RepID=UPI001E2AE90B|nr:Fe(3+) dicitrate ABC transporter permease subunit FecD [Vibrio salinus]MCE0496114.1 Fe(3+) dicitrate ABC transporter permease subunit FecD [Vibrio salinus]